MVQVVLELSFGPRDLVFSPCPCLLSLYHIVEHIVYSSEIREVLPRERQTNIVLTLLRATGEKKNLG